ncbi:MAG: hypothetical protein MJK13_14605 [Pseudomonadales bacterium]|nr:hypothetical protein [Pseudomonadales bacterium]
MSDFAKFFKPAESLEPLTEQVLVAGACLDGFTERFNACDLSGMDSFLHFPHIMYSAAELLIWEKPGQLPSDFFDKLVDGGWARTVTSQKTPILVSKDKVHFRVHYTRQTDDGTILTEHDNIWFITRIEDRWGIALRSY